jgi:hypothetical protein
LAVAVEFDYPVAHANIQAVRPDMLVFSLSAESGDGMEAWLAFLTANFPTLDTPPANAQKSLRIDAKAVCPGCEAARRNHQDRPWFSSGTATEAFFSDKVTVCRVRKVIDRNKI